MTNTKAVVIPFRNSKTVNNKQFVSNGASFHGVYMAQCSYRELETDFKFSYGLEITKKTIDYSSIN